MGQELKNHNAFPRNVEESNGLSKREYFIGQILSGGWEDINCTEKSNEKTARDCIGLADEILRQLREGA